jgi:small subunit ribosomal protein S1
VTTTVLPYVHRITKYDPADRDPRSGGYHGPQDSDSDHGPLEAAYLQAVAWLAEEAGVRRLAVREPSAGPTHGLTECHDGVEVSVEAALRLIRGMLRGDGMWCRLEAAERFAVHIGWDQYMYVGSAEPCPHALTRIRAGGLFAERIDASPYDFDEGRNDDDFFDADGHPVPQRPADEAFWSELHRRTESAGPLLLEETHLHNASRWHAVTSRTLNGIRRELAPRAMVAVWPNLLTPDIGAVLAEIPEEYTVEVLRMEASGGITVSDADEADPGIDGLRVLLKGARAAAVLPIALDEGPRPLFTGVLPDADGVLRARWRTRPTAEDIRWAGLSVPPEVE